MATGWRVLCLAVLVQLLAAPVASLTMGTYILPLEGAHDGAFEGCSAPFLLSFDPATLRFSTVDGLSMITAQDHSLPMEEGAAALPTSSVQVVIHPYAVEPRVKVLSISTERSPFSGAIMGMPKASVIGTGQAEGTTLPVTYPSAPLDLTGTCTMRGVRIAMLRFDPVQYLPPGELIIFTRIEACVVFSVPDDAPGRGLDPFSRPTSAFRDIIKDAVVNPGDIERFGAMGMSAPMTIEKEDIQYVVVTNSTKVGKGFDPFVEWKTRKGVPARVVEMSYIDDHYAGIDMSERVRNFLKDALVQWDTEYVLLGGDTSVVPFRGVYAQANGYTVNSVASDIYYSDLDGTFNADADGIWGETSDNTDLAPDMLVGRAPVQTSAELATFLDKTLHYEMTPEQGYLDNATLAGEYVDSVTNSSIALDNIKNNLLPDNYIPTSLYDKAYGQFGNLNRFTFMASVDEGASLIFHSGHSNYNVMSVGTSSNSDLYSSNVPSYCGGYRIGVMSSVGCIANQFNQNDCIAELHVMEPDGGSVAFIGNSHYGWYAYGAPGYGPSELYMYRMALELLRNGETGIAEHFARGKEYYLPYCSVYNSARWVQMVLNLIGEPEMDVRTADAGTFNVSVPTFAGLQQKGLRISVRNETGMPVKGALVCLYKSDYYSYNSTDAVGVARFDINTSSYDLLNLTVTGGNFYPYFSNISFDLDPPKLELRETGPATTGDEVVLNCSAVDIAGMKSVYALCEGPSLGPDAFAVVEMTSSGDNWTGSLMIPSNSTESIDLRIIAEDDCGNVNRTDLFTMEVYDNDPPEMVEDLTWRKGTTGDMVTFEVTVVDNIEVQTVKASCESSGADLLNEEPMTESEDGTWQLSMRVPPGTNSSLIYYFQFSDAVLNTFTSGPAYLLVEDDDRPAFGRDASSGTAFTGDRFTLAVQMTDNLKVQKVTVEHWSQGSSYRENSTLTEGAEGVWYYTGEAPANSDADIIYTFHARDTAGNWNTSKRFEMRVMDNDPPVIVSETAPSTATTGEKMDISIEVTDNLAVSDVLISYRTSGTGDHSEASMTKGVSNIWSWSLFVPSSATGPIQYMIVAHDNNGNENRTGERSLRVVDDDGPLIIEVQVASSVKAGDELWVNASVMDNVGLEEVLVEWWFGSGGKTITAPMFLLTQGLRVAVLDIPVTSFGHLYLKVTAVDTSGNSVESIRFDVLIIDAPPEDEGPRVPSAGEDIDGDGMEDIWEYENGLNWTFDDSLLDPDNDGFSNLAEYQNGTNPSSDQSYPEISVPPDDGPNPLLIMLVIVIIVGMALLAAIIYLSMERMRPSGKGHDGAHPRHPGASNNKIHQVPPSPHLDHGP